MFEVSKERDAPSFLIDRGTNMTIEVAIWALADAKRPVHVKRKPRVSLQFQLGTARCRFSALANDHGARTL